MAIYNAVPPPQQQQASAGNWTSTSAAGAVPPQPPTTTVPIDVEAWAATALASLSIDAGAARGTGTPLSIPLDDDSGSAPRRPPSAPRVARGGTPKLPTRIRKAAAAADEREEDSDGAAALGKGIRRPPSRRDSQRRREALLKGREGTRQRRRWENDRLVGVPNAVHDPLPVDFLVLPTHPVRYVEYRLAARWDQEVVHVPAVGGKTTAMPLWKLAEERREQEVRRRKRMATARAGAPTEAGDGPGVRPAVAANEHGHGRGHVSRELRDTAKHRPAVKRLVRVLEEPVRRFLMEQQRSEADHDDGPSSSSEEDDELVFVGRNGGMQDARSWKRAHREKKVQRTGPDGAGFQSARAEVGLVFDSPEDDESGAFKRWLTHSISQYYGLVSKSVNIGRPARRAVYVTVPESGKAKAAAEKMPLPPPMWELF